MERAEPSRLEVETDRRGNGPRRNIVRSAEGRKEVVKRFFVRQIDHGQAGAPLVLFGVKDVVVPNANVEKIARRNAGRVVVVVLRARGGNTDATWSRTWTPGRGRSGLIGVVGVAWTLPQ